MRAAGPMSAVKPSRDAAITALFVSEAARLTAVAQLLTGDRAAAEDLVQDAFVSLFRRWAWLSDKNLAANYLMGAIVKGARSTLRQRYSSRELLHRAGREHVESTPSAEATALVAEDARRLRDALVLLPMRQRQVVMLRYYAGQSEREIADTLGISPGSVKRHASRAVDSLARVLEATS